ncbi:hypothetical protein GQ457_01G005880 [Hibiscus cannabinus]
MCIGCILFSQQFHVWSHGTKSKLPPLVVALQDDGVLNLCLSQVDHNKEQGELDHAGAAFPETVAVNVKLLIGRDKHASHQSLSGIVSATMYIPLAFVKAWWFATWPDFVMQSTATSAPAANESIV